MKNIVWIFSALIIGFLMPLAIFYFSGSVYKFSQAPSFIYFNNLNTASLSNLNNLEILLVGDIMMSRDVENSVYKYSDGDFSSVFKEAGFIKNADISFANLEGPVSVSGKDQGNLYSFRFKPDALRALIDAGFDVLSVANNHAGDWGREAFEENIFRLKNDDIWPVGGGVNKKDALLKVVERDGVRVGFLGFSDVGPGWFAVKENKSGITLVDKNFENIIKNASRQVDILIVSIHFGEEYEESSNDRQKELARLAIDAGAKVVAGHHPHVIQEVEAYNGGLIAYSLGNFIFDQNFSEETMEGLALKVYFEGNEIVAVKQNKVKLNNLFQPSLE
ncbi:CapA family protein [Patescibacteria group bacterium]